MPSVWVQKLVRYQQVGYLHLWWHIDVLLLMPSVWTPLYTLIVVNCNMISNTVYYDACMNLGQKNILACFGLWWKSWQFLVIKTWLARAGERCSAIFAEVWTSAFRWAHCRLLPQLPHQGNKWNVAYGCICWLGYFYRLQSLHIDGKAHQPLKRKSSQSCPDPLTRVIPEPDAKRGEAVLLHRNDMTQIRAVLL